MPTKELERLKAVDRFLNFEFSKEKELQEIVRLAAQICGTPTALITLIDQNTQHIKFKQAFNFDTTARSNAFCNHVIESTDVLVVPDALQDTRFVHNPLVTTDPHVRFYAGAPLTTHDGHNLGSLCVIDQSPKQLSDLQQQILQAFSKQVIQLMEFEESLKILKDQYVEAKRSEIELRSFFESSIDCHLLLGKDFEILAFNKAWNNYAETSYGMPLLRGKSMTHYLHPENLRQFYQDYQKALKGTAVFTERKINQPDNEAWHIQKFEPAFDNYGQIIGVSVNSADVTSKVTQEQIVETQNDSLKEIAFIQSHELRRPVASILGLMEILVLDGHVDKIEELQLLKAAVAELDKKIRQIVNYADI